MVPNPQAGKPGDRGFDIFQTVSQRSCVYMLCQESASLRAGENNNIFRSKTTTALEYSWALFLNNNAASNRHYQNDSHVQFHTWMLSVCDGDVCLIWMFFCCVQRKRGGATAGPKVELLNQLKSQ